MTGLTEAEHVVAGFAAGGCDYVTKPIRPTEVLARVAAHLQTSRQMHQTRGALDAFGQAAIAIVPSTGKIVWQTPLARQWIEHYAAFMELQSWVSNLYQAFGNQTKVNPLTVIKSSGRLIFTPVEMQSDEQWIILLREESDAAQIEALIATFTLTRREAEVLYWAIKGKTNRDIGDILGTSPRTINKHLEHVFAKLGVETRTAASALARSKIVNIKI
jgi:DNA-binding CsgD family transcriptional regulator